MIKSIFLPRCNVAYQQRHQATMTTGSATPPPTPKSSLFRPHPHQQQFHFTGVVPRGEAPVLMRQPRAQYSTYGR